MDELLDEIYYGGPKSFSKDRLEKVRDLFSQRLALLFTPTECIPSRYVGRGPFRLTLPVAIPSIYDLAFRTGYDRPKMWLDLLQRATGKIRWTYIRPAVVTVTKFDSYDHGAVNRSGCKALQDALKMMANGRRDRRPLFYFGAIFDDNCEDLRGFDPNFRWQRIRHPKDAHLEIEVEEARNHPSND